MKGLKVTILPQIFIFALHNNIRYYYYGVQSITNNNLVFITGNKFNQNGILMGSLRRLLSWARNDEKT